MDLFDFLPYALIPIVIFFFFSMMKNQSKKAQEGMSETSFKIQQPKYILWLGIACTLLFSALFVLLFVTNAMSGYYEDYGLIGIAVTCLLCIGFISIGLALIYSFYQDKLIVSEDTLFCSQMFNKKQTLQFKDLSSVRLKQAGYGMESLTLFHKEKKIFRADSYCAGFQLLLERVQKENILFK
ncbi:MAG: hypothetical protein FWH28_00125 [Clostridiales bacterium]|nr:hypothetical protein [Clostridiales bacterium]